ncbi:VOC family protein [Parvibaculum sp.]|uniref:VOC family protein n=1 Tax=Parvibaculum sp. TaxID=2024848 RepID=UPI001B17BF1C|nr:VOC family protein [Parvibaculum sp.]MBO6633518.1 VOC family protein [Parvibaculum sp.]MBO6680007.1 VOC family protein [Parvibaculum sp.]MBO6683665.1 VOC family protein [Parvibaculum sp.]MBO6905921.1 VOC family protein [Parvibaculum sp.]
MTGTTIRPFLMFEGKAEEAMNLYVSLFPGSRIDAINKYGPGEPGAEGTVQLATLSLAGQTVMCIDSPVKHAFTFTPSFSFFVDLETGEELERIAAILGEDGAVMMPLDNYGFSRMFTWLSDRYGVSWQLNLP